MSKEKVCSVKEIPPGRAKSFKIRNYDLAIFNIDGTFYAINRKCTHLKGNLSRGKIEGKTVTCPLHGAKFDLKTGELLEQPGSLAGWFKKGSDTKTYEVMVDGDQLFVELPD